MSFKLIYCVTKDGLATIKEALKNNLMTLANLMNLLLPYLMYFESQRIYKIYGPSSEFVISWELVLPILFALVIYYVKSIANKLGKGITVPVPTKRFTEVDEDGMVSVNMDRIQELLLYMTDLEDWLEKKGML